MEVARGGAVGLGTVLQTGRSRVRFPMLSLENFIEINLPVAQRPIVMNSESLNLLECSEPVQGLICLLWCLTAFICWIRQLWSNETEGRRGGFNRVETRRNQKRRNGEYRAVRFIQNMQSAGLVSCWGSILSYVNVSEVGLIMRRFTLHVIIGCRVRNKWRLTAAWITKKWKNALNGTEEKNMLIYFIFTAFIRKVSIDSSPFRGGNFSASVVGCVG